MLLGCSTIKAPSIFGSITGRYRVIGSTDHIFRSSTLFTSTDTLMFLSLSISWTVLSRSILSMPTTSACRFASANGFGVGSLYGAVAKPLIAIARWNKPSDSGLIMCIWTETPPAEAPIIVIELGSPPNALILRLIHFNANVWSFNPKLPGLAASPVDRKPTIKNFHWKKKIPSKNVDQSLDVYQVHRVDMSLEPWSLVVCP